MFKEYHFKGISLPPLLLHCLCFHVLFIGILMVFLFMLSSSLWYIWVTASWAKKPYCPSLEWMNSSIPKEALNEHQWVDENHWVISPQTQIDSTGNNVALINVYSSTKKKLFVRTNRWINSFSSLILRNRMVLTALVIEWLQDLGDHTVTAEENSLKYVCTICAQTKESTWSMFKCTMCT